MTNKLKTNTMKTQKQALEVFKQNRYTVMSFNPETGKRESTYGRCDIITAMGEIILRVNKGFQILIFDGNDENINLTMLEIKKGSRITYDEVKHLALKNTYSQPVNH